jgi:8-amino-7-oxononanoate synthase
MREAWLKEILTELEKKDQRRQLRAFQGPQGVHVEIDGRPVRNFCSNDYLGLANDQRLKIAMAEEVCSSGVGSGASRLVCGNFDVFSQLEKKLALLKETESCLFFSSGYMANLGIISAICGRDDLVVSDRLNHASIIDGITLSRAQLKRYAHVNMQALENILSSAGDFKNKLIVTDSVFSMDGDIAPLPEIVALARKYHCLVMVDEAHAFGVLGKTGQGAVEHFGLKSQVDIQMGTLSKAVGAFGAYCCGSQELIDVLINKARSFIYTTGLPPGVVAASLKGVELIAQEPGRRIQLWENAQYLLAQLKERGFNALNSQTPIIPIVVGEKERAVEFSKRLLSAGFWVAAIRPPTVPEGTCRLRLTVTAAHQRQDLDDLLEQINRIGKELCII